jgi:hypothetical protein
MVLCDKRLVNPCRECPGVTETYVGTCRDATLTMSIWEGMADRWQARLIRLAQVWHF